jgi:hypothetical protein
MIVALLIALYIVCSVISTGWLFAYERHSDTRAASLREDLGWCWMFGLFCGFGGPVGVIVVWLMTGFGEHGWRLK